MSKLDTIESIGLVIIIIITHILINLPIGLINYTTSSISLNIIYISFITLLLFLLINNIFKAFPNKDLIDITKYLGGNILAIIIGIIFILYFLITLGLFIRGFSESLQNIYFPTFNISSIILFFIICALILNHFGFNTIVKVNLIILPIVLFSMLIIFFSSAKQFDISNLFPILGNGLQDTFVKGFANIYVFGDFAILYFIPPLISEIKSFRKIGFLSIIISSIYIFLAVTSITLLFSTNYTDNLLLSLYNLTKKIEFTNFFKRADALFILLWILSIFSYTNITIAFCIQITKKVFKIQDTKGIISSLLAIVFSISLIPTNIKQIYFYENTIYKYLVLSIIFILSFLILIFALFKKKILNKNNI